MNKEGTIIATCSDKGTLIRLWDALNGEKWAEFRRGSDQASISHLVFDDESKFITVSSDKDTVHVFKVPQEKGGDAGNTKSYANMLSPLSTFAGSEWSFAKVRFKECEAYTATNPLFDSSQYLC